MEGGRWRVGLSLLKGATIAMKVNIALKNIAWKVAKTLLFAKGGPYLNAYQNLQLIPKELALSFMKTAKN